MLSIHVNPCPSTPNPQKKGAQAQCLESLLLLHDPPWATAQRFHQRPRSPCLGKETQKLIPTQAPAEIFVQQLHYAVRQDQPRWYFEQFLSFHRPGAQSLAAVSLSSASLSAGSTLGRPAPAKDMMQSENIWNLCTKLWSQNNGCRVRVAQLTAALYYCWELTRLSSKFFLIFCGEMSCLGYLLISLWMEATSHGTFANTVAQPSHFGNRSLNNKDN